MPAAENVKRQIAITIIITVKEPPLLMTMQRIVGRIEIVDDLSRRLLMRLDEQIDQQPINRRRIVGDLVIARRLRLRQFEAVQCRFASHRRTVFAPRRKLAREHRENRIMAQVVMVDEIFIAKRDPENPLPNERLNLVLDPFRVAPVLETGGKTINSRIARLVAPSSKAPASDVIAPPSNEPTT